MVNNKLELTFASGEYDRLNALMLNEVEPEGLNLNYIKLEPEELFWRAIQNEEFDIFECSLGAYFALQGKYDNRFVAIPVFPSREFRHSAVYVNKKANIQTAHDLKGKKIGVPDYTMTATVWIRGFLEDDFNISASDVTWYKGGLNSPGRKERVSVNLPETIKIFDIGDNNLSDMLRYGEIDALIGSREPDSYNNDDNVLRLWPNYKEVEKDYFTRTQIFPIMHTVVIKTEILDKHPWVAYSLFKAFCISKDICQKKINNLSTSPYMLPWYRDLYSDIIKIMGEDYWPYGMVKNKKTLKKFAEYCYNQGLTNRIIDVEDLFVKSTLNEFII